MEDFKDVMLSEPPQRHTNVAPAPAANALSLESYKGILLCDRPADARGPKRSSDTAPFLPPGNTDTDRGNGNVGLPPTVEHRAKQLMHRTGRIEGQPRAQKNTALSKHRKWLQSFATEMKRMQANKTDQQIVEETRKAALRDREASRRRAGTGQPETVAPSPVEEAPPQTKLPPITKPKKDGGKRKPKWAMTEEEAEDAEFAEARDLVDFAAELDFDTYIKDFEVQEAIAIMRDRVQEIAAEKGIDIAEERRKAREADGDDASSVVSVSTTQAAAAGIEKKRRRPRPTTDDDRPAWNDSTNAAIRTALEGDALKLAERVLQSSDNLRKVHSKMSMAKLLQDVAIELNGSTHRQVTLPAESAVVNPAISLVAAEANGDLSKAQPQKRILTDMRHSKSHVQNLPYLYRCPSI